jgi:hypothetical protein
VVLVPLLSISLPRCELAKSGSKSNVCRRSAQFDSERAARLAIQDAPDPRSSTK